MIARLAIRFQRKLCARRNMPRNPTALFGRVSVKIVVEIDPGSLRAAIPDLSRPVSELFLGVIVPIPAFRAMQANIDFVRRSNEFIWQSRRAAGAEDNACLAKGVVDFLVPPTGVPEV